MLVCSCVFIINCLYSNEMLQIMITSLCHMYVKIKYIHILLLLTHTMLYVITMDTLDYQRVLGRLYYRLHAYDRSHCTVPGLNAHGTVSVAGSDDCCAP